MNIYPTETEQADELMTPAEVAAYFRMDPKTVARWDAAGVLKAAFRTPGGHRRYRRADVIAAGQPVDGAR